MQSLSKLDSLVVNMANCPIQGLALVNRLEELSWASLDVILDGHSKQVEFDWLRPRRRL